MEYRIDEIPEEFLKPLKEWKWYISFLVGLATESEIEKTVREAKKQGILDLKEIIKSVNTR